MADRPFKLPIDCRGDLDTAMPITDRQPGTLIDAHDVNGRYLGPRKGHLAFTRIGEGPGTGSLYDAITLNGTNNACGLCACYEDAYGDLGTTFTLDIWFRLEAIAYASAVNRIGLYAWYPNGGGNGSGIDINIMGGASSDHEKIEVRVITSPTRTTAATVGILTGSTRISYGTGQTNKHHIRIVRNGAALSLYLDGVLDASSSGAISATDPINRAYGAPTALVIGYGILSANISFKGHIYGAMLRDGVYTAQPIEARMPTTPWARNVHHFILGRNFSLGGDYHYFDAGRFLVHPRLVYSVGGDITITSSVDDTAPAPAPVQALRTWTTRTNRTATSAAAGGIVSTAGVS